MLTLEAERSLEAIGGDGGVPVEAEVQVAEADPAQTATYTKSFLQFVGEKLLLKTPAVPRTGNHFLGHQVKEWTLYADPNKHYTKY